MSRVVVAAVLALAVLIPPTSSRAAGLNGLLAGVNGLLTFPADPFVHVITPPNDFDELPGAPATAHAVGLVSGSLRAISRAGWGALDVVLTPFWVVPTLSPKAQFEIIPFYEVEYEI